MEEKKLKTVRISFFNHPDKPVEMDMLTTATTRQHIAGQVRAKCVPLANVRPLTIYFQVEDGPVQKTTLK